MDKVLKYFRYSAKINGKHMPASIRIAPVEDDPNNTQKSHSVLDLGRTPNLRKLGVVFIFLWFIVSMVYFGMTYNVNNLPGSIYINNAILGGVELAANAVAIWIIKLGRRPAIVGSFAMAAASMLAICFAQQSYWGVIILAIIGKFVITPCFSYIYVATMELYPTQVRVLALGAGSALARLGGAVAPFIPFTYTVWDELPYIIFTVASVIGMLFALLLPESLGRPLPDSIASAEKMNVITCHLRCSCCRKRAPVRAPADSSRDDRNDTSDDSDSQVFG